MASIAINIQRSNDPKQPYYFDITRISGGVLAWSETYVNKQDCIIAANIIRSGKAPYEVNKAIDSRYWFHFKASNGLILCRSNLYPTQAGCTQDADLIVREAAQAAFLDLAA